MSQVYYEKQDDKGRKATPVTEVTPMPTRAYKEDGEEAIQDVKVVQAHLPPVAGEANTRKIQIPGISTDIYAAGDAFGTLITLPGVFRANKNSGIVTKIQLLDRDDEGSQVDVHFYRRPMTTTADNAAFDPSDVDILSWEGGESITTFFNWNSNQGGQWTGSHWVESDDTNLYIRCVTQGTPTIVAGSEPWLLVTVVPN